MSISTHRRWTGLTVLALTVLGLLTALGLRPPEPVGADAPADEFSAQRALDRLGPITEQWHPAGSAANDRVREYLLGELRALGLTPTTDTRVAARSADSQASAAGTVTNVQARIPGTAPTGRILLAAHYDSVPTGPGAADDGAGLVTILEALRNLREHPPRNDVDIVFTDAEEAGLLGAQGFLNGPSTADPDKTVVLNLEARGTSGPAIMFQTAGATGGLMPAAGASGATATSLSDDVYRLLPNDTDLTVFGGAGMRGLNFAFVDGSANYHTAHDDLAHLSPETLQDMGNALSGAMGELAEADLRALGEGEATYFTTLGTLIRYPMGAVLPLAVLSLAAVAFSLWYQRNRGLTARWTAVAAISLPVPMAVAGGLGFGLWWLLTRVRPDYPLFGSGDPHRTGWYVAGFTVLAAVVLLLWFRLLRRKASGGEIAHGVLGLFGVLAVVSAVFAPGVAYLLTWPALFGALALIAARRWAGPDSVWHAVAESAAAAPAILLGLPVVALMFPLTGIALAAVPLAIAVLFAAPAAGLVIEALPRRVLTAGVATATVAALGATAVAVAADRPDPAHPRPVSLGYALDADTGRAYWVSAGPDDPAVAGAMTERTASPTEALPSLARWDLTASNAPGAATVRPPELEPLGITVSGGTQKVRVRVRPAPNTHRLDIHTDAEPIAVTVHDRDLTGGSNVHIGQWRWGVRYAAPPAEGVELTFTVPTAAPLRVNTVGLHTGLPGEAGAPTLPSDAAWTAMPSVGNQTFAARSGTL